MTNEEKSVIEKDLQHLVVLFDMLYAQGMIGVSKNSAHLDNETFYALADRDIKEIEGGHMQGYTKNGLRITTIID